MSQAARTSRAYRPGVFERVKEGLRYGGGVGQYAWLLHRLTGIGVLVFLIIHIVDTFFVVAYPDLYDHTVAIYGGRISGVSPAIDGYYWPLRWLFRVAELGLIASVLFHSLNGVRVALLDLSPGASRKQESMFRLVLIVFVAIMIPVTIVVLKPLLSEPEHGGNAPSVAVASPR